MIELIVVIILIYLFYFFPEYIDEMKRKRRQRDGIPEVSDHLYREKEKILKKKNPRVYEKHLKTDSYYY